MEKKHLLTLSFTIILVLAGSSSTMATITGISADGCPGTTCLPSFSVPIILNKTMTVTVKGQFVDLATKAEVSGGSASLANQVHGNNSSVDVVLNFNSLGDKTVKLRYAIETNGPDTFKVTVIRGGTVDQIQQRVPFLNNSRLIAANAIPVNQRVTLVFTGSRLSNAAIAPIQAISNPQTLPGCSDSRCEFELEFTKSGPIDINLYDAGLGAQTASALAINGTLFHFFYGGAKQVTVTGQATSSPAANVGHPLIAAGGGGNATFLDVAPGSIDNLFRGTGNSITVGGVNYLEVDNHWCQDNGVPTPPALSPPSFKDITVGDIVWHVSNVGTATVPVAFDSQLLSNGLVLQTQNVAAGLTPAASRGFNFHRASSTVRLFRLSPPNQSGCFIKPNAGSSQFFVDPPFTVKVDTGHAVGESVTNQANNTRNF
jgi:hypothetical protein